MVASSLYQENMPDAGASSPGCCPTMGYTGHFLGALTARPHLRPRSLRRYGSLALPGGDALAIGW